MNNDAMIKMLAVGDLGLIGQVSYNLKNNGITHPFVYVQDYLRDADVVFGNLEMPFSSSGSSSLKAHQSNNFFHEDIVVDSLLNANFNLLSIANNHIMECGEEGLFKTIQVLEDNNVLHVGAGQNIKRARQHKIIEENGIKIGFLAYTMKSADCASDMQPGPAPIHLPSIIDDVNELTPKVDFLVVSLHFGMMYMEAPSPEDINLCHALIDSGVDIILGHHPHVLQGVEEYNDGLIFYSLGEFVFDRKSGVRYVSLGSENRRNSAIAEICFNKHKSITYKLIPTYLNDNYQVVIPEGDDYLNRIDAFNRLADILNNSDQFYKNAGSKLVGYELGGLLHHLKNGNIKYILSKLTNIRIKHLKLFLGFCKNKIFPR